MYKKVSLITLAIILAFGSLLQAQNGDSSVYNQRLLYVDTHPGKGQEWRQLVREVSMKVAQMQADSGEILSWTLLRSVYPAGQEARSNYLISVISAGHPKSSETRFADDMKSAGVKMSAQEYFQKRNATSSLVAAELWQPRIYNGAAEKGNYLSINMMEVKDWNAIGETTKMFSEISKEFIKKGSMSGWVYATKSFPSGTDTVYPAYSANIYPNMEAAFDRNRMSGVFSKVHPGKDFDEYREMLGKARNIASRELWTVVERVTKSK